MSALFMDPFARGSPIEFLFFIPPANKGDADEGIARGRCVRLSNSIAYPRTKGSIEGGKTAGKERCRHD